MIRKLLLIIMILITLAISACRNEAPDSTTVPESVPEEVLEIPEIDTPSDIRDSETTPEASIDEGASAGDEKSAGTGSQLHGFIWALTELNGHAPLAGSDITGTFTEDGVFSGSAGCNRYSTSFEIDANQIRFGLGATTQKMCFEEIMDQEMAYLDALETSNTFEVSEDNLVFFDDEFQAIVIFEAVSQELAGSSWEVISYNNGKGGVVSLLTGTELTAVFDEEGQLNGNAGCNSYFGSYQIEGDSLAMGPFGATLKACLEPEGVMDQEAQYLAALESVTTYKIDGLSMTMFTEDGATAANFRRVMPSDQGAG